MDATVSARVPVEVRDRVHAMLRQHGSSPTELINSAYLAYLKTGQLPKQNEPAENRVFTPQQKDSFLTFMNDTSVEMPAEMAGKSFAEMRAKAIAHRYANRREA